MQVTAAAPPSPAPPSTAPDARSARLQAAVDDFRQRTGVVGVSAAVVGPDGVQEAAAGARAVGGGGGAALTPHDTFHVASITKTAAAAVVLRAVERGELDLDAPLSNWRPDFPLASQMTVRMLLDHTAGVPGYVDSPQFQHALQNAPLMAWPAGRALEVAAQLPRRSEPGTAMVYSNSGYLLLQQIAEAVAGRPMAEQLHDELVAPLGLDSDDAQLERPDGASRSSAHGHARHDAGARDVQDLYRERSLLRSVIGADGGMVATAPALAQLGHSILASDGQALSTDMHHRLLDSADRSPSGYGLGAHRDELEIAGIGAVRVYGHSGGMPGFTSLLVHAPRLAATAAILVNQDSIDGNAMKSLAGELLAAATQPAPAAAPAAAAG